MPDDASTDLNAYVPPCLEHLHGQTAVKEVVRVALEAAWTDGTRFPHALLVGPPGTGKSLVSAIIARSMGTACKELLAQTLGFAGSELEATLLEVDDKDIVFIDEIHELVHPQQTLLFRAMEERKLFLHSAGSNRPPRALPLNDFTLLAATTDEYALLKPLRDRFRLILRFQNYTPDELQALVVQRARGLRWPIEDAAVEMIARRAKGTPRLALRLLEACRRTVRSEGATLIRVTDLERTCALEQLDALGLDALEQKLLHILAHEGRPVRLNVLASKLNLPPRTITAVVEPYLVQEGLISKDDDGRELTPKGWAHVAQAEGTPPFQPQTDEEELQ